MFKIATWNVNSLRVRLDHVLDWLQAQAPDILALQETKLVDEVFPHEMFLNIGYTAAFSGQKTYNGVAVISKQTPREVLTNFPSYVDSQRRILFADYNDLSVLNLYVPNGSEVGSEKYDYKLEWLTHMRSFVGTVLRKGRNLVILGDFNIAPADEDVHDPEEWQGKVLVSAPEREHFFQLLDMGMVDCYRLLNKDGREFSWWDYRAASFRRNRGLRIDHILASRNLSQYCRSCSIDKDPRALEKPSDHTPVVAEFDI